MIYINSLNEPGRRTNLVVWTLEAFFFYPFSNFSPPPPPWIRYHVFFFLLSFCFFSLFPFFLRENQKVSYCDRGNFEGALSRRIFELMFSRDVNWMQMSIEKGTIYMLQILDRRTRFTIIDLYSNLWDKNLTVFNCCILWCRNDRSLLYFIWIQFLWSNHKW